MNWKKKGKDLFLDVPIEAWEGQPGNYNIAIVKRPQYCDRGDWLIHVDGRNDLDYSDGFPRYFIGTEEEVKQQMERWLNRREAYQKWMRKNPASSFVTG